MAAPKGTSRLMSELKSRLMTPATTSHYEVYFQAPSLVKDTINGSKYKLQINSDTQILINLSCTDTTLPGSSFMTHEITNDVQGVTEQHVYRRSYDNRMDFTFMVDRNYTILRFFEGWMASITNEDENGFDPEDKSTRYLVKFPKDYQADYISITKFEKDVGRPDEQTQLQYTLIGAYPIAINSTPITYDSSNILKTTVSMAFIRYVVHSLGSTSPQKIDPLTNADIVGQSQIGPNQTKTEFLLPNGNIVEQISSFGSTIATVSDTTSNKGFR